MKLPENFSGCIWNSKIILKLIICPPPTLHPSPGSQCLNIEDFIAKGHIKTISKCQIWKNKVSNNKEFAAFLESLGKAVQGQE